MKDKAGKDITVGAPVKVAWGNINITGKVTGLDTEQNRVAIRDDNRGKGGRGSFTIEAHAVEVVTKAKR